MRIDPKIESILDKTLSGEEICREEAVELMKIDESSHDMYALTSVANTLTRQQFGDRGEGIRSGGHKPVALSQELRFLFLWREVECDQITHRVRP